MFGRLMWYIFGGSCPLTEFCQVQNSRCVQVMRSPILAALLHGTRAVGVSKTLGRGIFTRHGGDPIRLLKSGKNSKYICAKLERDGRPAEYRWRPLRMFRNSIPCTTPQSLADAHCWSVVQLCYQYRRTQDLDAKWILHLAKFHQGARAAENVYIVYQPRKRPNIVQSLVGLRWATSLQ